MDFDNPKVYGDTSICDGLVVKIFVKIAVKIGVKIFVRIVIKIVVNIANILVFDPAQVSSNLCQIFYKYLSNRC